MKTLEKQNEENKLKKDNSLRNGRIFFLLLGIFLFCIGCPWGGAFTLLFLADYLF
jgi:hypothetical protein